ncbi:MAG: MFS transporter [Sphingomonas sp.]|jgi:GPH family glycoside/pentoside/hexuronide:cation symporter
MIARLFATPHRPRLLLFAFGDFAFNLYWQSIILFLLFYYTDTLDLPVATAAAIYTLATVWDGIANFLVGAMTDRREPGRGYGMVLMLGSAPLGLACMLAYAPILLRGPWGIALVFLGHLLFRTAYAAINVPYLAMSARISMDSRDRAFVAGMRMLFGTMAWVLVARGTIPIGTWLTSGNNGTSAYFGAAAFFAVVGTAILMLVGATYREDTAPPPVAHASLRASITSLIANRAFVTLNLAMMAMIVAVTILNKSVLYYFKYSLNDDHGGQAALAWMGLISVVAVPAWMVLRRHLGTRSLWFLAAGGSMAGLGGFAVMGISTSNTMVLFLVAMQAMFVGLHFVFWAMLPNTIEFGERMTGMRVEGAVFGLAALLQRLAIGIATTILGTAYNQAGYVANVLQRPDTLLAMRLTVTLVPMAFLALSCVMILLNPLGHGAHARIVEDLAGED